MAEEPKRADATSLVAAIAEKAGRSVEEVRSLLARHGVAFKPAIAVPKHLCITSLAFTGEKKGDMAPGVINFDWPDLGPGLNAILSDRNFRGKSTLLAVMKWCLTGRRGKGVPSEMAEWFHTVRMTFTLDGQTYEVEVADAVAQAGTLWRIDGEKRLAQETFASGEGFEAVMSGFFMGQMGLQMLVTHTDRGEKGVDQPHDWLWLFGAMVIEPNPDVLFGTYAPLGARMMQMYLGVPWTNAVNDVLAAQNRIGIETRQAAVEAERSRGRRKARVEALDAEIAELRRKLERLPRAEDQRTALRAANRTFAEAQARLRSAQRTLDAASEDRDAAREAHAAARRDLHEFREGRAARTVFRSIDPVCCPRCDEMFDDERRQATREEHTCVVCGTLEQPEGNPAAREAGLRGAVTDSEAALRSQEARLTSVEAAISAAREKMRDAEAACRRLEATLAEPSEAYPLEVQLIGTQARREELADEEDAPAGHVDDQAVLRIAEKVTREAFKPLQDELLAEVSGLIKEYAVRFGVESLEDVRLQGNTTLVLMKGGGKTHFGKQTDGEKVRLKIAATLALIKVAERRGLGRHPGLLLIDSPGSNEMVGQDYESLVAGLAEITKEIGHLQVFVAAINNETIRGHVPRERLLYAEGDEYLW
ncbi:hypothetical protein [Methylobacterium dankookense]|uniref:Uncharacterized protein n=1 Tax=Methylobacterium dankookense TaxID=560405 RepID=A0A564FRD2_9HYPH|nr:hypothetical protein [Methylobacterium dankookense]GJD58078.1 hypothetical protein IFDJLNFL_3993 [Methylobacterium dankookense]VUF10497.1 hypothetical protein MTDSW087_00164 [Methylobacterium dankookense]